MTFLYADLLLCLFSTWYFRISRNLCMSSTKSL